MRKRRNGCAFIENQLEHRRNLSDADKMDLAEAKRELIEAAQPKGGRPSNDEQEPAQNFAPVPKDARSSDAKIGKAAGVSRETVRKYRII